MPEKKNEPRRTENARRIIAGLFQRKREKVNVAKSVSESFAQDLRKILAEDYVPRKEKNRRVW